MRLTLLFLLPGSYLVGSRLRSRASWASMFGYDWLPQLAIIAALGTPGLLQTPGALLLSWLAFISLYELGYLTNDVLSVRFEKNPRRRIEGFDPRAPQLVAWLLARLSAFALLTFLLGQATRWEWWAFHGLLTLVFLSHNLLRQESLRVASFVGLALGRFMAPLLPWLGTAALASLAMPVLLYYVLFRLLGYLDGKRFLQLPGRREDRFRIGFYAVLLPVGGMASLALGSVIPLVINLWYLLFWCGIAVAKRVTGLREAPLHPASRGTLTPR